LKHYSLTAQGETPLCVATGYSWIDNNAKKEPKYIQLLLRYGADTNKNYIGKEIDGFKSVIEPGSSPLMHSIGRGIEKAKVSEPYYRRKSYGNQDPNEKLFPVNLLRYWVFDLDSKEYKMKMEIVEEFARQGVNYWDTKIHEDTLQQIKKLYPDTWEEYIKKY